MANIVDFLPLFTKADPMTASDIANHPDGDRIWATLVSMNEYHDELVSGYQQDVEDAEKAGRQDLEALTVEMETKIAAAYEQGRKDALEGSSDA